MKISREAPAKLNLTLAVTGARKDGFHDLISLAALIENLCDEIELEAKLGSDEPDSIGCDVQGVPLDESNLVMRATTLFRKKFPLKASLHWNIKKHVPNSAGLGGGSSDAATALLLLQEVSQGVGIPCEEQELFKIAEQIGSDVPFFLRGEASLMRGRGEVIEELKEAEALSGREFLVFKPAFGISTAEAYAGMKRNAPHDYVDPKDAEEKISEWRKNPHGPLPLFNNMERPAFRKYLTLPALFQILKEKHGVEGHMSGSGSACFVEISSSKDASGIVATIHECLGKDAFVKKISLR